MKNEEEQKGICRMEKSDVKNSETCLIFEKEKKMFFFGSYIMKWEPIRRAYDNIVSAKHVFIYYVI